MSDTNVATTPPAKPGFSLPRWFPRGRSALLWIGIFAIGAGLVLGWDWLVAAGVTPLLLSVLPCLVMCAVGLCAMRGSGKSGEDKTEPQAAGRVAHPGPGSERRVRK